jgi:hypothetical protein
MTFNFLFDVVGLAIYGLVFGAQQVSEGFWFLGLLFYQVEVVCYLCGFCFVFFGGSLQCCG